MEKFRIRDHISECLVTITTFLKFIVSQYCTILNLDPGWKNPDSGIRGKHPGSATLLKRIFFQGRAHCFSVVAGYQVHRIWRHHAGSGQGQGQDQEIQEENPIRFPEKNLLIIKS
jgi:hypothetical protein